MTAARRRLAWFAACCFVILFGLGEFGSWVLEAWRGEGWWGIDLRLLLDAGGRLAAGGDVYGDPKFLYPPLAAAVGWGLALVPFDALGVGYAGLKVAIAVGVVWLFTAGWAPGWRALAAFTLVASLPFVHDVMLGNANVLLVGAMVPAIFGTPRARSGLLLGLAIAVFAKPLAVPVLLWLIVWRPRVAGGVVAAGLGASAVGVIAAGVQAHMAWVQALAGGTRYAAPFEGNHGVTALVPELWLPVAMLTAAGLVAVLLFRGPGTGLVWALASGILISPYAGTYAALPIALALPILAGPAPMVALAVVGASPIATTHPLPVYAAALMLAAFRLPDVGGDARWWRRRRTDRGGQAIRQARWPALALERGR